MHLNEFWKKEVYLNAQDKKYLFAYKFLETSAFIKCGCLHKLFILRKLSVTIITHIDVFLIALKNRWFLNNEKTILLYFVKIIRQNCAILNLEILLQFSLSKISLLTKKQNKKRNYNDRISLFCSKNSLFIFWTYFLNFMLDILKCFAYNFFLNYVYFDYHDLNLFSSLQI